MRTSEEGKLLLLESLPTVNGRSDVRNRAGAGGKKKKEREATASWERS